MWLIRVVVSCHPCFSGKGGRKAKSALVLCCLFQLRVLEMISSTFLIGVKTEAWSCEKHLNHNIFLGTMINTTMLTFSVLQNKLATRTGTSAPHQVCRVLLTGDPQESSQFNLVPCCFSSLPSLCVCGSVQFIVKQQIGSIHLH